MMKEKTVKSPGKASDTCLLGDRFKYIPSHFNNLMSSKSVDAKHRIEAKIKRGLYRYERSNCYCGAMAEVVLAETDRYGNYYPFVICKNCGIMRANSRL